MKATVAAGVWPPGLAYLRIGSGAPLALLPGLTRSHRLPEGWDRRLQLREAVAFAGDRDVWWINRRMDLHRQVTIGDLAHDYAEGLRRQFGGPVDVMGLSTGGSVALQLAADHPDVVHRLVIVAAAYRLGPRGRLAQQRVAQHLRAGHPRSAGAELLAATAATARTGRLFAAVGWLLGTALVGQGDPDMLATIEAEDGFDLQTRLGTIAAPTLVVGGAWDGFSGTQLLTGTATGIPGARLVLFERTGHAGTFSRRRLQRSVLDFLSP